MTAPALTPDAVEVGKPDRGDRPEEIDEYMQALAEVFAEGTTGRDLLDAWIRDFTRQGLHCPGDPYTTAARAGVADFLLDIQNDLEIHDNVRSP